MRTLIGIFKVEQIQIWVTYTLMHDW